MTYFIDWQLFDMTDQCYIEHDLITVDATTMHDAAEQALEMIADMYNLTETDRVMINSVKESVMD